jgi:hypothetical protein
VIVVRKGYFTLESGKRKHIDAILGKKTQRARPTRLARKGEKQRGISAR